MMSAISKKALAISIIAPLLSVYLLSSSCTLGDLLYDCCSQTAQVHDASTHQHLPDLHQNPGDPEENCCTGHSIGFFSNFQVKAKIPIPVKTVQVDLSDEMADISDFSTVIQADASPVLHGEISPIIFSLPGSTIRILLQSFLN